MWWAPATSATQAGDRPTKQCLAASVADRTGIVTTIMCTFVTIQRVAQHLASIAGSHIQSCGAAQASRPTSLA
jgi:hypothetical protein